MKIVLAICVLFFLAAVQADTGITGESKDKRDVFLPTIHHTVVRPVMLNRVVQPIVQHVVQPVIIQKTFQTVVRPTVVQHHQMGMLSRVFKRSVESTEKRGVITTPVTKVETVVSPVVTGRVVVQPLVPSVAEPVITQKALVNPIVVQTPVVQQGLVNKLIKRSAEKDESKDKRDVFLTPIHQTLVRPPVVNRIVQPIVQHVVQPVITQRTFQTVVGPTVMQHHFAAPTQTFGTGFFKRDTKV